MKHVDMRLILGRAWNETLRLIEKEEGFLKANPENQIAAHKLKTYTAQEKEIHAMILVEERKIEKARDANQSR